MRGTITVLALIVSLCGISQDTYWIEAMSDPNANFFKANESFAKAWKGKEKAKHSGVKQFERWRNYVQPYVQPDGSIKPYSQVWESAQSFDRLISSRSSNGNWIELGPYQEENYSRGVGRLTTIAFHPTDSNTFYVGSPSGGIWITHDNGKTWILPKDDLMNFGVSAIAIDQDSPNIIYIGTGDADAFETEGTGVFKSTDGGMNWSKSSLGMAEETVCRILIDPTDSKIILAATRNGIYKSINSGTTWSLKRSSGDFRDMEFKPENSDYVYASQWTYPGIASFIFVSHDNGDTWTKRFVTEGLYPDMRQEIEVTPSNPDLLYGVGERRLVKSMDSGDTFSTVTETGNFLLDRDRQGWYNASFKIDPDDENIMYCGNVQLYKSFDAGLSWVKLNQTHSDNHCIEIHPITKDLYVLDDGGVHRSTNRGKTFEDLSNLGVAAIYSVAQSPFHSDHVLNGYQDCGSKYYDGYKWTSTYGADGMQALFDASDSTIFYTSYQYGGVTRYLNHIGSAQVVEKPTDEGPWVTPFILDYYDNQTMYQGRESLWKSTNMHTKDRKDVTWKNISNGVAANVGRYIRVKLDRSNPARIMAIVQSDDRTKSRFIKCDNIYDTNYVWSEYLNAPISAFLADFETDPNDSLLIYIISGNDVYASSDGGNSFKSMSQNLPDVPVHVLKVDTINGNLYAGSDAGVFCLVSGDTTWQSFSAGLGGSARVRDLDIYYHPSDHNQSKLKAATYGRGLWESDLIGATGVAPQKLNAYLSVENENFTFDADFTIQVVFKSHVTADSVLGFDASDLVVRNGTVSSIRANGRLFDVQITAQAEGFVYVDLPRGAVTSATNGVLNDSARTIRIDYLPEPISVGPNGPGGVGDADNLMLWLKASNVMTDVNQDTITADGEKIENWYDTSGKGFFATQSTDSNKPVLRLDTNGIAGWPAVEYKPNNEFLRVNNFGPVGKNITVFVVAESNTENWTGHAWIANAREENGFLVHDNNNSKNVYGVVVDGQKRYLGTPSVDAPNIQAPHVYTISYNERMWKNKFYFDDRLGVDYLNGDHFRDGNDSISIRLGKDSWERYGDGKLGEMIYYKEDIGNAPRIIVANYLAAKYGVDLQSEKKYFGSPDFKYDVAGIGQVSKLDYHTRAISGMVTMHSSNAVNDYDFLLWGHNNGSITWDSVKTGNGFLLNRTWYVSKTGNPGFVTIEIDSATMGVVSKSVALKIGSLSDMASNNGRYVPLSLVNGVYSASVDFDNNDYFTLVTGDDLYNGVNTKLGFSQMRLVPNPSLSGKTEIRFDSEIEGALKVSVIDNMGRQVSYLESEMTLGTNSIPLNTSEFSSGIYFVLVETKAGNTTLRLVR
ncbi:MAG: T9SS type A sorting domain-containing protein [Salibacteraceae bacterium]